MKLIFSAIIFVMTMCLFAQGSFAYAPTTTHAGLTQEMLAYYELVYGESYSDEFAELIIQASIDEDNPSVRALNHFNDPIHGVGINNYRTSYDWATNDLSGNDFTWRKGIEAYARGDERQAMIVLGHVLHLLEDSSVPDHTRNDPHIGHGAGGLYTGTSPLEDWAHEHKTRETLRGLGQAFYDKKIEPNDCISVRECFNFIALYSNQNFFSADTINSADYPNPKIVSGDGDFIYGKDEISGERAKLYLLEFKNGTPRSSLSDGLNYSVISEYFDRLAPQTIATGARLIELYFTEAKFARAQYEAKQKADQEKVVAEQVALARKSANQGLLGQFALGFTSLFIDKPVSMISLGGSKLAIAGDGFLHGYTTMFGEGVHSVQLIAKSGERAGGVAKIKTIEIAEQFAVESGQAMTSFSKSGQSRTADLADLIRKLVDARAVLEHVALAEVAHGSTLDNMNVNSEHNAEVLGASTTSPVISVNQTPTTPATLPEVRIDEGVAQGSIPLSMVPPIVEPATTTPPSSEVAPPNPPAAPPADTTAPDAPMITQFQGDTFQGQGVTLELSTSSVQIGGTAEASSTATLLVIEDATTTAYFYDVAADIQWSFALILSQGTSTLILTATDESGNVSSSTDIEVRVTILPPAPAPAGPPAYDPSLYFTEVAWSGTIASPQDEWIEIYNASDSPIDLSGLSLAEGSGAFRIPLSGTIDPHTYVVIASSPEVFLNYSPHITASFGSGLSDTGANIRLESGPPESPIVISEIPYCSNWCDMGAENGISMMLSYYSQRLEWNWDEWFSSYGFGWEIADRSGNIVSGIPGAGDPGPM